MFMLKKLIFFCLCYSISTALHAQENRHLLKFNFAGIVFGDYELSYETINDKTSSWELSLGATYKNIAFEDFQRRLFDSDFDASAPRKNKLGYSVKLAYRTPLIGIVYLSPQLSHVRYNFEYSSSNIYSNSNETIKEKIILNDFRLTYGLRFDLLKDKINLDIGGGFAIRQRNIHFFEEQGYYKDNTYHQAFGTFHSRHYVPSIIANCKLGFIIDNIL